MLRIFIIVILLSFIGPLCSQTNSDYQILIQKCLDNPGVKKTANPVQIDSKEKFIIIYDQKQFPNDLKLTCNGLDVKIWNIQELFFYGIHVDENVIVFDSVEILENIAKFKITIWPKKFELKFQKLNDTWSPD